ncbi:MAG: SCO family protein [Cyclobacteriaceae bacterium]
MTRLIVFCLVTAVIAACQPNERHLESRVLKLPYYSEATFTPRWFEHKQDLPADFHQIPEFKLINQLGEKVTEKDVEDKLFVVDFFFTACPGICPKMTDNMALVQKAFLEDEDVLILSHSVTPEYDSTVVLKSYADRKGVVDGKWHLLTGDRDVIYDLGRFQYFAEEDLGLTKSTDDFLHTENFILVDGNRHIRGIYNGLNKTSVNQLILDITMLKLESSSSSD